MSSTIDFEKLADRARELDARDPLARFRDQFHIPIDENGNQEIYFAGNSLGLQPKQTQTFVLEDLESWKTRGVRGHFEGDLPWVPYHEFVTETMAGIVGGRNDEVVMMNSLTTNLHLMMATFYRPDTTRRKILLEEHAFPSDHYAVESQIRWHNLDPASEMVILSPEKNSELISTDRILQAIDYYRDSLALVLLPGVQYYTGQVFDMSRITQAAQHYDIPVGFDLAHAAGNVKLELHDWNVDFAVWCSYKYLNSGPGSVGGCFVNQKHAALSRKFRLAGWWGQDKQSRFQMENRFQAIPTAEGWQLSNPPILSLSAVRASLDLFKQAGIDNLISKSKTLTGFLVECLDELIGDDVEIVTPREASQRGCQLSLKIKLRNVDGKSVHRGLQDAAIRTDWREPNVIRAAPVPFYNCYWEIHQFAKQLQQLLAG